jgi:hypothetical protein
VPAQWDAWDATGQYYYLRFRSGLGSVHAAVDSEDLIIGDRRAAVASFEYGDQWAGEITLAEFAQRAGLRLTLDVALAAMLIEDADA